MKNQKSKKILIVIILVLVVIFLMFRLMPKDRVDNIQEEGVDLLQDQVVNNIELEVEDIIGFVPAIGVNSEEGKYFIDVENQLPGDEVMVSSVFIDQMGWVTVRENERGNLGNVLGARRLDEGNNFSVVVPLQRNTEPGQIYHITLYIDDGDRQFDIENDLLVFTEEGELVVSSFKTFE